MVHSSIKELWQQLGALATQLDAEEKKEAYKIAELLAPMLAIESTRVKDHVKEFIEADGSQRDALLWTPLPWRQAGLPFPSNRSEVTLYACIYGVLWCLAVKELLQVSPQELAPLVAKALQAKENILDGYAQMIGRYWDPVGSWLVRFINHGAGALADTYFGKAKVGRIVIADSVAEVLARVGFEGAISARDSIFREEGSPYIVAEEGSPYIVALEALTEVIESRTPEDGVPPASAVAEIFAATIEFNMRLPATFLKELAQKDSKTRHRLENAIVASMAERCKQLVAESSIFGHEVDEDLKSIIGFDMRRALARDIVLTYKKRKVTGTRRREPYQSLKELCEEAGAEYKFVETFGIDQGMLPKRGSPNK